jgi:hypothetical protein
MTKMSKAQRTAILDFHNGVTAKCHTLVGNARTLAALVANGWAFFPAHVTSRVAELGNVRVAYVTTAGLVAAGVDMDAIYAEALEIHEIREEWHAEVDAADAARQAGVVEAAHADALDYVAREQHIAQSGVSHVRDNCPARAVGGCMKCTAPATVRAARGER